MHIDDYMEDVILDKVCEGNTARAVDHLLSGQGE